MKYASFQRKKMPYGMEILHFFYCIEYYAHRVYYPSQNIREILGIERISGTIAKIIAQPITT